MRLNKLITSSNIKYVGKKNLGVSSRYGTDFKNAFIKGIKFEGTEFARQSFEGAIFENCTFVGVNFYNTNFKGTILKGCVFKGCNLHCGNITNITVENCFFYCNEWHDNAIHYSRIIDSTIMEPIKICLSKIEHSILDIECINMLDTCKMSEIEVVTSCETSTDLIASAIKSDYIIRPTGGLMKINNILLSKIVGHTLKITGECTLSSAVVTFPINIMLIGKESKVCITESMIHTKCIQIEADPYAESKISINSSTVGANTIRIINISDVDINYSNISAVEAEIYTSNLNVEKSTFKIKNGNMCNILPPHFYHGDVEISIEKSILENIDFSYNLDGPNPSRFRRCHVVSSILRGCNICIQYGTVYNVFHGNTVQDCVVKFPSIRGPRMDGNIFMSSSIEDINTTIIDDTCGTEFHMCHFTGISASEARYIVSTNRRHTGEVVEDEFKKILYTYERKSM